MKFYFSQASQVNQTLSAEEIHRNALLDDLENTKKALEIAYMGFDNVTEPDLIDCYIYELNSVLKRYNFILEQVGKLQALSEPAGFVHSIPESAGKLQPVPEPAGMLNTEAPAAAIIS